MRTLVLLFVLSFSAACFAEDSVVQSVIKLSEAGTGEAVQIAYIESLPGCPSLSAEDLILLKKNNVSDRVLEVMLRHSRGTGVETKVVEKVERQPVIERAVERPAVVERVVEKPTIVERTVEKPIIVERTVEKPVIVERTVERPVVVERYVESPVVIESPPPVVVERSPIVAVGVGAPFYYPYPYYYPYPSFSFSFGWYRGHGGHGGHPVRHRW
jgi:hypothetical protein